MWNYQHFVFYACSEESFANFYPRWISLCVCLCAPVYFSLYLFVCMPVCVCLCFFMCVCVYACMCVCLCLFTCLFVCLCAHLCDFMCVCECVCIILASCILQQILSDKLLMEEGQMVDQNWDTKIFLKIKNERFFSQQRGLRRTAERSKPGVQVLHYGVALFKQETRA